MIVLVTGGREFNDLGLVFDAIAAIHSQTEITWLMHGDAKGADSLADKVASEIGINRIKIPANWTKYGKAGGAIRNRSMIDLLQVDLVLAFPGGTGTADMKRQATAKGIPVIEALDLVDPK
jgi:hypothetical protein